MMNLDLFKKFSAIAALGLMLAGTSSANASATYDYSYTFGSGDVVTGSFTGDANGNLITDLSNISASVDGVALNGSGNLFGSSLSVSDGSWVSGGAVASFDGTQNDFLFIDVDYPNDEIFTNYFGSVSLIDAAYVFGENISVGDYPITPANWSVTEANAVPEPQSVALMGLGLLAAFAARRKSKQ